LTAQGPLVCCAHNQPFDNSLYIYRKINQRPQMAQFLCLKNIRLFLTACQESFGITEDNDLFDPPMLYNFRDFAMVLQTLSKLSGSTKAKQNRPDINAFPERKPVAW